jgi:hypothetical protein
VSALTIAPSRFSRATLALILLFTSIASGQQRTTSQHESPGTRNFTEIKGQPESYPTSFQHLTATYKYRISRSGRGTRTGAGSRARHFNLRLDKGFSLQNVIYYAEHKGGVLLLFDVSDGESGAGDITKLDRQTLRIKWKRKIPAFNIGEGLIEGNHAYVTGIGFVAKVNLISGALVWRHGNLYRNGDFNSFELPRIEGDTVLFEEVVVHDEPAKTIKVEKRSGKIISIS